MTNVQLSAEELQLVKNGDWILTKQRVVEKVYLLFGNLCAQMQQHLKAMDGLLPEIVLGRAPKISKGEQYLSLPYVVLDYPRLFSRADVFAVRSFFWWGNYFSITLHLKGSFQRQAWAKIEQALAGKKMGDVYVSFSGDEFNFNLPGEAYLSMDKAVILPPLTEQPFLKLSYKWSFEQWDVVEQELLQAFKQFMALASA